MIWWHSAPRLLPSLLVPPPSPHASQNVPSGGLDAGDGGTLGADRAAAKTECVPVRMHAESRGGIQPASHGSASLHGDLGETESSLLCKG